MNTCNRCLMYASLMRLFFSNKQPLQKQQYTEKPYKMLLHVLANHQISSISYSTAYNQWGCLVQTTAGSWIVVFMNLFLLSQTIILIYELPTVAYSIINNTTPLFSFFIHFPLYVAGLCRQLGTSKILAPQIFVLLSTALLSMLAPKTAQKFTTCSI